MRKSDSVPRRDRRFRPDGLGDALTLEPRRLLSGGALHAVRAPARAQRVAPATMINREYAAFLSDFRRVEQSYIAALNDQAAGTTTVTANLVQPYLSGGSQVVVDNASVFGPNGSFAAPVTATVTISGVPNGAYLTLVGRSGNTLIVDPAASSAVNLAASGVALTASVPATAQSSAAALFPTFIVNRANQMAINLVIYFNGLPQKLPYYNAPPRTPNQRGAIQNYVYSSISGGGATNLVGALTAIPLPATAGADLQIYDASVASAVEQSRLQVQNGVSQIFSGKLKISIQAPSNRLGIAANSGASAGGTSTPTTTGA
ncbi:MAG: hypothetical protein P4L85_25615 [Paludisphaera borealis]|uniref:hypothetical protein n=1 Tax=Paludisphaera borealis TaxID=1387353 RepID=UPI002840E803|nr:hypothetical protein [Paludisphaera borealis]MDR3622757.1 hypothetical protein [Paludisphaera borealis]